MQNDETLPDDVGIIFPDENEEDSTVYGPNPIDTVDNLEAYGHGLKYYDFTQDTPQSRVWWTSPIDATGTHMISFDCKKLYHVFGDVRHLTGKEREIFIEDEPFWANLLGMI